MGTVTLPGWVLFAVIFGTALMVGFNTYWWGRTDERWEQHQKKWDDRTEGNWR